MDNSLSVYGTQAGLELKTHAWRSMAIAVLLCTLAATRVSEAGVEISASGAYRFDALVTHIAEGDVAIGVAVSPKLHFGATVEYLDATQTAIAGIRELRGQVVSGLLDFSWRTARDRLLLDMQAGVDGVVDWQVTPRVEGKVQATVPLPANRVFPHIILCPEGWYRHRMPNGPAISNRIASYGYAAEVRAPIRTKGALAATFRQEYLEPADAVLDTSYLVSRSGGIPLDTLEMNTTTTFYAYGYYQVLTHMHLGYAFTYTNAAIDRRVATFAEPVVGSGFPPIVGMAYEWAYYPYPTPQGMLAHIVTAAVDVPLGGRGTWKTNVALPVYSRQRIRYLPDTVYVGDDLSNYPYQEELFTGPLTFETACRLKISDRTELTIAYDYFGFPYRSWAYFTEDSYSLHTVRVSIQQRFQRQDDMYGR